MALGEEGFFLHDTPYARYNPFGTPSNALPGWSGRVGQARCPNCSVLLFKILHFSGLSKEPSAADVSNKLMLHHCPHAKFILIQKTIYTRARFFIGFITFWYFYISLAASPPSDCVAALTQSVMCDRTLWPSTPARTWITRPSTCGRITGAPQVRCAIPRRSNLLGSCSETQTLYATHLIPFSK